MNQTFFDAIHNHNPILGSSPGLYPDVFVPIENSGRHTIYELDTKIPQGTKSFWMRIAGGIYYTGSSMFRLEKQNDGWAVVEETDTLSMGEVERIVNHLESYVDGEVNYITNGYNISRRN